MEREGVNVWAIQDANALTGRVLTAADGQIYTVTSASSYGEVCVWDPRKQELIRFDSRATFEHWAYGTPVASR